jgi:hypothetical protein
MHDLLGLSMIIYELGNPVTAVYRYVNHMNNIYFICTYKQLEISRGSKWGFHVVLLHFGEQADSSQQH